MKATLVSVLLILVSLTLTLFLSQYLFPLVELLINLICKLCSFQVDGLCQSISSNTSQPQTKVEKHFLCWTGFDGLVYRHIHEQYLLVKLLLLGLKRASYLEPRLTDQSSVYSINVYYIYLKTCHPNSWNDWFLNHLIQVILMKLVEKVKKIKTIQNLKHRNG